METKAQTSGARVAHLFSDVARRWVTAAAAALLVLVALPGVAAASRGIAWAACGDGLECATVAVPLDWSHPHGAKIELPVIRRPATGARIGSLFVSPGGPGDSGVAMVRERGAALAATTGGRFDIVGWDVRGSSVSCFATGAEREAFWAGLSVPSDA